MTNELFIIAIEEKSVLCSNAIDMHYIYTYTHTLNILSISKAILIVCQLRHIFNRIFNFESKTENKWNRFDCEQNVNTICVFSTDMMV